MGGDGPLRADPSSTAGRPEVRPARRPAVRQRADSSGHGSQQDSQGFRREVPLDGGLRRAVYSRATTATGCRSSSRWIASSAPKKREMSVADFRRACRAYAERFIGVMTQEFERLGIFGDWAHPYVTMDFRYQAAIARALGRFVEQGLVYKGKKPVHWCIHCRTALAEAEVEYEAHSSPSIYVEFALDPDSAGELAARIPAAGAARRRGPDLDDDPVDDPVEPGDRLSSRVRLCGLRCRGSRGDRRRGARLAGGRGDRASVWRADCALQGHASSSESASATRSTRVRRSACWPST